MKKIPAIKKITVMMSRITDGVILFFIKIPLSYDIVSYLKGAFVNLK